MAKQSFSVGQVLTAAQMTSLQQTAMGGGSPVTKTSSYVLTAADAGTVIQVNSTSATTITVNTGLFSAGDSVQIQNIGAGVMTITAGTATVNSAGSLGVTQYDGGFLYFSSDSSAIWFDFTQAGTTLPLTTKGDLFGYSTTNARVPVGANNTVLTADSAEALGVKWATPSSGGMTLISTTTLTGATVTIGSIPSTYVDLVFYIEGFRPVTDSTYITFQFNADATAGNHHDENDNANYANTAWGTGTLGSLMGAVDNGVNTDLIQAYIPRYANTTTFKFIRAVHLGSNATTPANNEYDKKVIWYKPTTAISSFKLATTGSGFTSGTVYLYGVK